MVATPQPVSGQATQRERQTRPPDDDLDRAVGGTDGAPGGPGGKNGLL